MAATAASRNSFLAAVLSAGLILLITIGCVAPQSWLLVIDRLLRELPWLVLWLAAALGAGGALLRCSGIGVRQLALMISTSAALGFGVLSYGMLGLGWLGVLKRGVCFGLIVLALSGWCFAWTLWRDVEWPRRVDLRKLWPWLPIVVVFGVGLVAVTLPPGILWTDEPHGYDVLEYHLQVPREWYELGRVAPLAHNVFAYLPMNAELQYLLAMELRGGPWEGMYLAQMMNGLFAVLTVLACGNRRSALLVAAVPWLALSGTVCYVEAELLLYGALMLHWLAAPGRRHVFLAGVFAGLACGVKLTALPMLVLPAPLILLALNQKRKIAVLNVAIVYLAAAAVFAPWALRSFLATHNPLFPEAMNVFGRGPFSLTQQLRWEHSLQPPSALQNVLGRLFALGTQFAFDWRWGWALLPMGMAAVIARRSRAIIFPAALLIVQFAFWCCFTHLQGRFLILSLPPLALLAGRSATAEGPAKDIGQMRGELAFIAAAWISVVVGIDNMTQRIGLRAQLADMDSLTPLLSDEAKATIDAGGSIALIGDARAFLYPLPMSRLKYRTVFDVDMKDDQSLEQAWLRAVPSSWVKIVDQPELKRLSASYYGLKK